VVKKRDLPSSIFRGGGGTTGAPGSLQTATRGRPRRRGAGERKILKGRIDKEWNVGDGCLFGAGGQKRGKITLGKRDLDKEPRRGGA